MDRQKLNNWLHRTLYDDREEGPCVKLVMRHINVGGQSSKDGECFSLRIPHTDECVTLGEDEVLMLVNDIEAAAHDDAEGLGGLQRYRLLAYFKLEARPLARFTFRMVGSDVDEDEIGMSEPATKQGLMGQMMRHNEALMRTAVLGANQTIGLLTRTVNSQGEQIEKLLVERRETFEMVEDLKSQRHERELLSLEAENRERRYQEMFEKASILVPTLVNRIGGRKLLPESSTPFKETVRGLVESLEGSQLGKIMPHLTTHQQVAFMEIFEQMKAEEEAKSKEQQEKKNGSN